MIRAVIRGIGSYVPPRVVTNDDLARLMNTSDAWIRTRTGIRARRIAPKGVNAAFMAAEAGRRTLAAAGMGPGGGGLLGEAGGQGWHSAKTRHVRHRPRVDSDLPASIHRQRDCHCDSGDDLDCVRRARRNGANRL